MAECTPSMAEVISPSGTCVVPPTAWSPANARAATGGPTSEPAATDAHQRPSMRPEVAISRMARAVTSTGMIEMSRALTPSAPTPPSAKNRA